MPDFVSEITLKRDIFSETHSGHFADAPGERAIRRIVTATPLWSRPLAWTLARREIRALRSLSGLEGVPRLIAVDRDGLYRSWTEGTPLHLARPADPAWYRDAHRLLRAMRRRGVTHNDLAKPQNWLMTPEGRAAVIDFQLASRHRARGPLFRFMAYEDFRHLIKQRRAFAPELMTPTARRVLARRSLPSRIWFATGKKLYNFVTRNLFHWSDGEGTGDRLDNEGPAIVAALKRQPGVRDVALTLFSLPAKGVGLYAFVETDEASEEALRRRLPDIRVECLQPVRQLPRGADGLPRHDILRLVATNQMTDVDELIRREPDLAAVVRSLVADRRNFTDRRLTQAEARGGR